MKRRFTWSPLARWQSGFIILSLLMVVVGWTLAVWRFPTMGEPGSLVPLHYNIFLGIDYVGQWQFGFFLPGIATLVLIVNTVLAQVERKRVPVLTSLLIVSSGIVSLLALAGVFFVLLLNT